MYVCVLCGCAACVYVAQNEMDEVNVIINLMSVH